jgi:CheY-like chemotaxis protein/PAS domain-containing protein
LRDAFDLVDSADLPQAATRIASESFDGVFIADAGLAQEADLGSLLQSQCILEGMPDGLALLDHENTILWGNRRLREWSGCGDLMGQNFYQALGSPEILGPDFCPFHTALATGFPSISNLRTQDNRYFQVHAAPLLLPRLDHPGSEPLTLEAAGRQPPAAEAPPGAKRPLGQLVVTIRDVTSEVQQRQKLAAIHQAGIELTNLTADAVLQMSVDERIELLKSNILHYTKDLLHYDVVEIRLLDPQTGRLEPLLAVGMTPEAAARVLYARPQDNGVTGFVAATGKSYLCEDTTQDPLYLVGFHGAKSSLTVPLILNDEVIGTFNVESPEPRAFTEGDLQFVEIFTRDLALALHTLDLLAAEKASTAAKSVEAIHGAVAIPVDDILNDAVNIMEHYIGHQPDVAERLQRILRNARDIKQVIQKIGQKMAPSTANPFPGRDDERPMLRGAQILVVDVDESVRSAAHALLERFGCVVETAHNGAEALCMVRNTSTQTGYDCIIADVRLPDMAGYELMQKLQLLVHPLPLVLMTGFGYDPGHSIVKARQSGLRYVLYKPFRLDQLLDTVQKTLEANRAAAPGHLVHTGPMHAEPTPPEPRRQEIAAR